MRIIIAGSRNLRVSSIEIVNHLLEFFDKSNLKDPISNIVSGGAKGIDSCGEALAKENDIPLKVFSANWDKYGRSAGPRRNKQMAEYADALLLIWDGKSRGSKSMKTLMEELGKPVFEVIINQE